jgi:hypothetical protein
MKCEEIIRDILGLDGELAVLDDHCGLLSADFYRIFH